MRKVGTPRESPPQTSSVSTGTPASKCFHAHQGEGQRVAGGQSPTILLFLTFTGQQWQKIEVVEECRHF